MIACAIENEQITVVADDGPLRRICLEERLPLVGTVGLLMQARLDGHIPELKALLDQLIAGGFRLDPAGSVYRNSLARCEELPRN